MFKTFSENKSKHSEKRNWGMKLFDLTVAFVASIISSIASLISEPGFTVTSRWILFKKIVDSI